jgi:hypothetical protein
MTRIPYPRGHVYLRNLAKIALHPYPRTASKQAAEQLRD